MNIIYLDTICLYTTLEGINEIIWWEIIKGKDLSHTGDKIHIKLPVGFVKKMIKNNTFDFFYGADDMIDSQKL